MRDEILIDQFGKEERYRGNYSDFIDQDQLARNDFYHYKKGYELGIKELETTKKLLEDAVLIIEDARGVFKFERYYNFVDELDEFLAKLKTTNNGN